MNIGKIIDNVEEGKILFVVVVRNVCWMFLKYEGKYKMNIFNCIFF